MTQYIYPLYSVHGDVIPNWEQKCPWRTLQRWTLVKSNRKSS